ncbi:MAG: substrate-binding domain-containing protein [Clostridia bacterium]|nr:substrate-binding domain-containing protein [Clostridia bacterium]
MLQKRIAPIFLIAAVLSLSACGETEKGVTQVDGLEELGLVQIVSREEGSGTRSAFADLAGFAEANSGSDATTENAQIASDAESVCEAVTRDISAIGYVSMGTTLNSDVKTLDVDGAEGSLENVINGKYSLSRPFTLVWTGELNDVENDFLTYVMGKGQAIVQKSYANVRDECDFLSDQSRGTITIHGSTSVTPLLQELANEYETINPNASIVITASDSTQGINDAMQGLCDIGMASRELKDYEKELLNYRVIAYDGIAVIVNAENPLDGVTFDELNALFTGEITSWEEINERRK